MDRRLLLTTALHAGAVLGLALPAQAQPAPNARPAGGSVVAGAATIAQSPTTTTVDQSSQRAAINWQSFNIGSQQTVQFDQPSSSAVTLNRVIGPNPSQIAGRIDANGQVIITNQSGVTFYKGAQVNTAGLMVSAAGIGNANFMAGHMVFDQAAKPNASVTNQGTITVRDAGLAALVAPQVANSGVITARLGHVVLAGAQKVTLDLYGDGLMSIDVTGQVVRAPDGATALVTNSGVIRADGGTVQLTAQAADGLVQTLVNAGGKIRANTIDGHTGTIVLNGVGGSITVAGQLTATGNAAGTTGGNIAVDPTGSVALASSARIDASGQSGGGVVAIGTTLARAKGGPGVTSKRTAANVTMAAGATIAANATAKGNGGRVALLSRGSTTFNGAISVMGGLRGGNGGMVETSGNTLTVGQSVTVDRLAPLGRAGTWLQDPTNLDITTTTGAGTEAASTIDTGLADGNVTIMVDNDLTVSAPIVAAGPYSLAFEAGRSILVNANITMDGGSFTATANDSGDLGTALSDRGSGAGNFTMASGVTIDTSNDAQNIQIAIGPSATNTGVPPGGNFTPGTITLGNLTTGGGDVFASGGTGVMVNGAVNAGTTGAVTISVTGPGGITLDAPVNASTLGLDVSSGSGVTQDAAGVITADTLGIISAGSVNLVAANAVTRLAGTVTGSGNSFVFRDAATALTIATIFGGEQDRFDELSGITTNDGQIALSTTTSGNLTIDAPVSSTGGEIDIAVAPGYSFINTATGLDTNFASIGSIASGSGNIVILADAMTFGADTTVNAGTGTLVLGPATTSDNIVLGAASSVGTLGLQTSDFATMTAGMIQVGYRNEDATASFTGNITIGGTAGISLDPTDIPALLLVTSGPTGTITQTQPVSFGGTGTLGIIAGGNVTLNGTANAVGTLAGFADNGSSFSFSNIGLLTVGTLPAQQLGVAVDGTTGLVSSAPMVSATGNPTNPLNGVTAIGGGNITLFASGGLTLNGNLTASGETVSLTTGGQITQNAGIITAGTLTGSSVGGATLTLNNAVGTLGPFSDTASEGDFGLSFTNAQALQTAGTVSSAGPVTLTTTIGGLTLGGDVTADFETVTLNSAAGITQNAGLITASALAVDAAGPVSLLGPNAATTLSGIVTGSGNAFLFRDDSTPLTVGFVNEQSGITTNDGRIALSTTTSGDLTVDSSISSTGGEIDITAAPGATFANTAAIESSGGNIVVLADEMTLAGTSSAIGAGIGTVVLGPVTSTRDIVLGSASTGTTLGLQTADLATITAAMVQIGYRNEDATPSFTGAISIAGTGAIDLDPANVPTLLLVTGGSGGTVSQSQPVSFGATGGTLGIIAGGDVTLTGANSVGTIAGFADNGSSFAFTGNRQLTVGTLPTQQLGVAYDTTSGLASSAVMATGVGKPSNPLTGVTTTAPLALVTTAGGLTLDANVTATGSSVTLSASGPITQPGGLITAATLLGNSVDGATLTQDNAVGTLGPFSDTGTGNTTGLSFTDGQALQTSGVVSSTGPLTLTTIGGGLMLGGNVTASGQTVTLASGAAIDQTGGSITAATLTGGSVGGATLTDANAVGTLGPFSDTGTGNTIGLSFTDGQALLTSGAVSSTGPLTLTTTSGGMTLGGNVTANGQTATLSSAGAIDQAGGSITAAMLTGSSVGGATLKDGNAVGTLGPFSDTGTDNPVGLSFTDGQMLYTSGVVSSTGPLTLTTTVGGLTLGGNVTASGQTVTLASAGAIDQTGGSITAATLTGSSVGGATLTDANAVGTLGPFSDIGTGNTTGLSFTNGQALLTSGVVSSTGPLALTTTSGNNMTLGGNVTANGQTVTLSSAGGLDQTTGVITAAVLTGSSVGGATLTDGNAVGTLGPFSDTGAGNTTGLSFTDGQALQISGVVSSTGPMNLTTTAGGLTLGGDVTAGGQTVTLTSAGAIDQVGGSITGATLTGSSVGGATLTDANAVGTLGPFSDTGTGNTTGLSFTDSQALLTSGAVSCTGPLTLTTTSGGMTLGGDVTANGQTVTLSSAGTIGQAGGLVTAALLTGSSVGGATLRDGNAVGTLGPFSDTGTGNTIGLSFTDGQALHTSGVVSSTGPLTLTTTVGGLTLGGNVTASGQTVTLASAGAIDQTSGSITAATLTGSSVGGSTLTDANAVGTLGPFSDTGTGNTTGLSFTNGQALRTGGIVSSTGPLALTTTAGGVTLGGNVTTNSQTVTLTSAGAIDQATGMITAAIVTGSSVGGATLTGGNAVGTLGPFSDTGTGNTTGLSFTDGQALQTFGAVSSTGPLALTTTAGGLTLGGNLTALGRTVTLTSAGAIEQTAGAINAAALTGSSAGNTTLMQANAIRTLGPFTVGGDALALYDAAALTIIGPVSANFLTITATGRMTLAGNIATLGAPLSAQTGASPAPGGSTLQVLAVETKSGPSAQFIQTGTVMLTDPPGTTLRIQLPASGGSATFADLDGPGANLVLALGSGTATGTMQLGGLFVLGQSGSATLVGSIAGVTTQAAAGLGQISPAVNPSYTFNDCTIGLLVCGAATPPLLPPLLGELAWFYAGPGLPPVPPLPTLNLIVLPTTPLLSGELAPQDVVPPNISFEDY